MVATDKLPSLASIRAFEAAARVGSFAQAATELGTTAASVSYHVRQLELQLGMPLFRAELDAGRLVPAHDVVGTDGRAFWFLYPAAREHSRKIVEFGKWIEEEARAARDAGASFIRRAK